MQDTFSHCEALVRDADKDRFLATLFAPADRRPHLCALYAFNIEIARVREVAREALAGEIRLQWWRDAVGGHGHGEVRAHPVAAALLDTIARCALPLTMLNELIEARRFDLYDEPMATLLDLETYARRTSSAVIELAAKILDPAGSVGAVAAPAGVAYALAGLLKAFPFHVVHGRLYLPVDVLERHDVRRDDIFAGKASAGLVAALAEMRRQAQKRLEEAIKNWAAVPADAAPAFLPVALVRPLLARMERHRGDPFTLVELPQWRRQWILWRAARRAMF